MKNRIMLVFLIIALLYLFTACGEKQVQQLDETTVANESTLTLNSEYKGIDMQRKDLSIKNEDGEVLAVVCFDLPQLKKNSLASQKVNSFLLGIYESWKGDSFYDYDAEAMNSFLGHVYDKRKYDGDECLIKWPYKYLVVTNIAYFDRNLLSVVMHIYWNAGGPNNYFCVAYTFDMKTGDRIPFTDIMDFNIDEFKKDVSKFFQNQLFENFLNTVKIRERLSTIKGHNLRYLYYDDEKNDLAYEYYYNGKDICILLQNISEFKVPLICKWNKETGDAFCASLWGIREENGIIVEYHIDG